uniref:Uncharacterized protein n=1 Tax=Meloidogyne floridensis TaxID=298350 RepID=A0A915PAE3_9BILA
MSPSIKICFLFFLTTSIIIQLINSECRKNGFLGCGEDEYKCCDKNATCTTINNTTTCKTSDCQAVGEECGDNNKNCCGNLLCGENKLCECPDIGKDCVKDSQCCGNYCMDDMKCH